MFRQQISPRIKLSIFTHIKSSTARLDLTQEIIIQGSGGNLIPVDLQKQTLNSYENDQTEYQWWFKEYVFETGKNKSCSYFAAKHAQSKIGLTQINPE